MTQRAFRQLVDAAIEERRPLDTPTFARLAESAEEPDRRYWQLQARLDAAIAGWRAGEVIQDPRPVRAATQVTTWLASRTWRRGRSTRAAATLALGLSVVAFWPGREEGSPGPIVTDVLTEPVSIIETDTGKPAAAGAPSTPATGLAATDTAVGHDGFAEATETAERLAYAFQPVGDQVGSVVRLLIDSVPGSDVFSM